MLILELESIQSFKIDMFWKAEKTEKDVQSFPIGFLYSKYEKNCQMCKNGCFSEKNQKTPSNFIFYPKVCYHLSRYSPGNLKKLGRVVLYKVIEKMACTAHS